MFRPKRRRFKGLNVNTLIPNMMTLLATCAGLTAIRWGLQEKWEIALLAVLAAAILDALDGRIARLLKGTSKFGAELDSLSDFVAFGVTPALLLYLWVLQDAGRFGWMITLLFALACGLRLARFNVADQEEDPPAWASHFFSGVPAPAAAGLVLLPMMLAVQTDSDFMRHPVPVTIIMLLVAGLMVSPLPTYSFKKLKIPHHGVMPLMLVFGVTMAALITAPWVTLTIVLSLYMLSMPFSVRTYLAMKREAEAHHPPEDTGEDDAPTGVGA
ncbi:CDP-diacylglycerol--serine O-phosphatidyltransferase [Magnetospira sp. QH-2]|uniref:CDP-diacylglycerol--serine O-phosphatidyltransferase n=1 Tax=Magnetospira sp. (strain QH-2) TaxID=1288970 RepID=UPI0003E81734|nr:CDP-diacylglycerol--serine O-phosphatidyltransferase [Magnetospira sp. QH-2]CCQ74305.1 Putative phosphatidylserine synthase (CDP-diacylglycerol--serine O-phosphatidyltransferase) [pssA] [Magnetospira sp. QH-2]